MNISYRIPIYQYGGQSGIKYQRNDPDEWRRLVFSPYRQHILDQLKKYGEANDYGYWLNDMQGRHAKLYKAAEASGDWKSVAYRSDDVGKYQQDYRGGIDNNGTYKRYGSVVINPEDRYNFNETGIRNAQNNNRYDFFGPSKRLESDRGNSKYLIDNLYSGITDDRRLLGRKGDWDESSDDYKQWQKELNAAGWETFLDTDDYYKLRRLNSPAGQPVEETSPEQQTDPNAKIRAFKADWDGINWNKIGEGFQKLLGNPNTLALGRLAGNLINNGRVYDESLKGIKPALRQTYNTYRQVVGDEATKQAYYRRAAQGQTKAARPFTSDADRQMAYQFEAKRVGDELRAQGDLADNQEIRRTSDESNQHQWANTQRATEVANANIASINQANALKHNLLAQKHSAQWSSIDNYLKELEYRKRQRFEEQQAIDDQIFNLQLQQDLLYDDRIVNAQNEFQRVLDKHKLSDGSYDTTDPEVLDARKKFNAIKTQVTIDSWNKRKKYFQNRGNFFTFAKSGTKVTYKKKDDLLYKSTRDVVEHFRKMSKISSDAQNRKKPKIEKLTSHPKGTKKYQQGGVAPFTVYTPVALGGETSRTASYDTSSSSSKSAKDDKGKETLDFIKNLFKELLGKGLPVDVNTMYSKMNGLFQKYKMFGEELDTNDIALMYLQSMQQINGIMHSKEVFDKAKDVATKNEALNEFAVTADGSYVVQDKDGNISFAKSLSEIKENGLNPITNQQLLYLRAYNPDLLLNKGDYIVENVINNGMGLNKIGAQIKALAGSIGSSTEKIEGISQVESNKIKAGLQILAGTDGTPDGYYQVTQETKQSQAQVQAALTFVKNMLSPSQRAILDIHSGGNTDALIGTFLSSQTNPSISQTIAPLTGKASKGDGTTDSNEKIKSNPLMQMIQGEGGVPRTWELITRDSNVKMSVGGMYYSQIPKVKDDTSLDVMLSESGFSGVLDSKQGITFGDQQISPDQLKDVMYSNTGGMIVTLPCKIVNGHKEVNLGIRQTYEEAVQAVESKGITKKSLEYAQSLGKELKARGLDSLLDSNGLPDRSKFGQFLVVEAYTTTKLQNLDTSSQYIEKVNNPSEELEQRLIRALSTNNKKDDYSIDINYWLWGDDVYRATAFIPLTNNLNAAINAWGDSVKVEDARELENKFQNFNKASTMKLSNSDLLL